jgi:hypothetical protein
MYKQMLNSPRIELRAWGDMQAALSQRGEAEALIDERRRALAGEKDAA